MRIDVAGRESETRILKPGEFTHIYVSVDFGSRRNHAGKFYVTPSVIPMDDAFQLVPTISLILDSRPESPVATTSPRVTFKVMSQAEDGENPAVAQPELKLERILGHWQEILYTKSGTVIDIGEDVEWNLKTDVAIRRELSPEPPSWTVGTMTLDTSKSPAWLDFKRNREVMRVWPAIIRRDGERLTIALREHEGVTVNETGEYNERPTSFVSTTENGVSIYVLEPWKPLDVNMSPKLQTQKSKPTN